MKKKNSFAFFSSYYSNLILDFFKSLKLFIRVVKLMLPATNIVKDLAGKKVSKASTEVGKNGGGVVDEMPTPVNSLIAPFGIDVNEFCVSFNELTKNFKKGLPVRVFLFLLSDRKFFLRVKITSISLILKMVFKLNSVTLLDLYKIYLISSMFFNVTNRSVSRIIFGSLRSFNNIKVIK